MTAYKFFRHGAVGLLSGFRWPVREWVEVTGPLVESVNGVHACRLRDLPTWIDDELWTVELAGETLELEAMLVARRGRLTARVASWTPEVALELAETCVWRVRDQAVRVLRRAGLLPEADKLAAAGRLEAVEAITVACAACTAGRVALVAGYAADAVAILEGRPSFEWPHLNGPGVQTPGDTAACLAGHAAMTAGLEAAEERGEGAYAESFADERAWQSAWLVERLGLPA